MSLARETLWRIGHRLGPGLVHDVNLRVERRSGRSTVTSPDKVLPIADERAGVVPDDSIQ